MRNTTKILLITLLITLTWNPLSYSEVEFEKAAIRVGGVELLVEVAISTRARERGLMDRDEVPEGTGMLFVYPRRMRCRLWMKDTLVPLSVAFIKADGQITKIVRMEKIKSTKIYRSKEKVKYALEVPLGWFEKNGIEAGGYCAIPDTLPRRNQTKRK
ncbi:MAG: DUF192 domain-containing protein [Candidatus Omnitrophica bacterium]|nr:DUF192 domain-containing protein [Candidatus Omnitrophota bacterium]